MAECAGSHTGRASEARLPSAPLLLSASHRRAWCAPHTRSSCYRTSSSGNGSVEVNGSGALPPEWEPARGLRIDSGQAMPYR